ILAVTRGGNHVFGHVIGTDSRQQPVVNVAALEEILQVFADDLLSPVYVGWTRGYLDEQRAAFESWAGQQGEQVQIGQPRQAFAWLSEALAASAEWMAQENGHARAQDRGGRANNQLSLPAPDPADAAQLSNA